jgi:tetratricopeptide (TPR) repeat protein
MATPRHSKITRKELKQPDEFITALDWAGDFLADNLVGVIVAIAVVVVAVGIAFGISTYFDHRNDAVAEQFYLGVNALSEKDFKAAQQDLGKAAEHSSTLGHVAQFYLATTYLAQNQPAKARSKLQAYLESGSNPLFRQMALTQLGVANEDLHAYANAHVAYAEAARLQGPEKTRAEVGAARTLALQGDRAGAIKAYQAFLNANPFTAQRPEVIEALAQLGVAPQNTNALDSGTIETETGVPPPNAPAASSATKK